MKLKKEGRQPGDSFPELMPYFEENSQKIREKLKSTPLETLFEEAYEFAKLEFNENGLTLYSNAMIHYLYAEILSYHQENEEKSDSRINMYKNCFSKKTLKNKNAKELYDASSFLNNNRIEINELSIFQIYFAEESELYVLPILSETGIVDLVDLNTGIANSIVFLGLSLEKSSFDELLNVSSVKFYRHDCYHIDFAQVCFSNCIKTKENIIDTQIRHIIDNKNRYKIAEKIYSLIGLKKECSLQNFYLDHVVYYFLFHEHGLGCNRTPRKFFDTDSFTQKDFADSVDSSLKNIISNINIVSMIRVNNNGEKSKENFSDINQIIYIHPKNSISIYDFIKNENINGFKIPIDKQINYNKNKKNDDLFSFLFYNLFDFRRYNFLITLHELLKPSGINFNIWENNNVDENKIIEIVKEIFKKFKERYNLVYVE